MPTPRIPTGLKPLVASYSGTGTAGAERTEVEGGSSRYSMAFDRGTQTFNVALSLSPTAYSVWNAFYHRVINKGTITFIMELDAGFGCQDIDVNILPGTYSIARTDGDTVVSFQVECENPAYDLSDDDVDALLALYEEYGEMSNELLARIARFATVDSLVLDF